MEDVSDLPPPPLLNNHFDVTKWETPAVPQSILNNIDAGKPGFY